KLPRVRLVDDRRPAQAAFAPRRLAAQDVLLERLAPQKLAALGALEALRGPTMSFQFRHRFPTLNAEPAKHAGNTSVVFSAIFAASALIVVTRLHLAVV